MTSSIVVSKRGTEWSRDLVGEIDASFPLRRKTSKRAEEIRKNHAVYLELRNQMRKSMDSYKDKTFQVDKINDTVVKKAKNVRNEEVKKDAVAVEDSLKAMQDFIQSMQSSGNSRQFVIAENKITTVLTA